MLLADIFAIQSSKFIIFKICYKICFLNGMRCFQFDG